MNSINISKLPYRDNISCVVFKQKKFLLVQRVGWPNNWWKFPQGGINESESEENTVRREFLEELGSEKFKIIAKSVYTNQYDWTDDSVKLASYQWRGQIQKFFLVEFLGADEDIKINKNEIQQYKWVGLKDLLVSIDQNNKNFSNYKNTIEKILREFKML